MNRRLAYLAAAGHLMNVDDPAGNEPGGGSAKPDGFAPISSQEEFDRRLSERLNRERAKFSDYDDLKAAAARLADIEAANASEIDRAKAEAKREGASEVLDKANARLRSAEARALAAELKFRDPSDSVRLIDLSDVTVSEQGDVDAATIRTRLEELARTKAYLIDDGKRRPGVDPGQGQQDTPKAKGVNAGRDMFESKRKPAPTP